MCYRIMVSKIRILIVKIFFVLFVSPNVVNCGKVNELVELNVCEDEEGKVQGVNVITIPAEIAVDRMNISFRLKHESFGCLTNMSTELPIQNLISIPVSSSIYQESLSGQDNGNFDKAKALPKFNSNGSVFIHAKSFDPMHYCISLSKHSHQPISITTCQPECNTNFAICVNKCCPPGQVIDMETYSCTSSNRISWIPPIYRNSFEKNDPSQQSLPLGFNIGLPSQNDCNLISSASYLISRHNRDLNGAQKTPFRILATGNVIILNETTKNWDQVRGTPFCMDGMQNFGESKHFTGLDEDDILIMCESGTFVAEKPEHLYEIIYSALLFISAAFLLITSIIQCMILETKSAHGWTILYSMVSMLFTYLFLGVSHAIPILFPADSIYYLRSAPCVFVGVLGHYFLLCTFAWMTVFDYDIWKTFRSTEGLSQKFKSGKTLYMYSSFGFGVPGVIVVTGFCLDVINRRNSKHRITAPNYGQENCYISREALGYYVYSIIGLLMIFNLFFICSTATNIQAVRSSSRNLQRNSKQQSAWELFGKLFIIMGVTWILEVISWIHSQLSNSHEQWYWTISDIINLLQPIAIFIIVVCKRKTARQLQFKFNSVKNKMSSFSRTSLFTPSSSSRFRTGSSRKGSNVATIITLREVRMGSTKFCKTAAANGDLI